MVNKYPDIYFNRSLSDADKERWEDFWLASSHASARQHYLYGEIQRQLGRDVYYVWAENNEVFVFAGVFHFEKMARMLPAMEAICLRGPVFNDIEIARYCLTKTVEFFRSLRVGSVRVGPRWIFPEAADVETMLLTLGFRYAENPPRRTTGIVAIDRNDEELIRSFGKSTRYQIRAASRLGVTVQQASRPDEFMEFYKALFNMNRERGIDQIDLKEFTVMAHEVFLSAKFGTILNAYFDRRFVGGILLYRDGQTAYTFKMVVADHGIDRLATIRVAPLLFFSGMQWARAHGCRFVDVEGYRSNVEAGHHLELIYRYKKGFRPVEIETLSQYRATTNALVDTGRRVTSFLRRLGHTPGRIRFRYRQYRIKKKSSDFENVQNEA